MQTNYRRQTWGFDPNYIRVEALDDQRRPLGYVYFVRRTTPQRRPAREVAERNSTSFLPLLQAASLFLLKQLAWN